MTQKDDKRVSRAINNAESRKKCLLLVNNIVDESLRGTPLLTQSQASEIAQAIKATAGFDATGKYAISDEQRACMAMLDISHLLCLCLLDVQAAFLDAKAALASLQVFFMLSSEYQDFGEFLNELCWTKSGTHSARLQDRAIALSQLIPYHYVMSLKEEDNMRFIDLKMPDELTTLIFEDIERVKQKSSSLKALIKAMRDVMSQKQVPIRIIIEMIDDYEERIRKLIRLSKGILYRIDIKKWEELRATLASDNPKVAMMDALTDYDDLTADEIVYEDIRHSLGQKGLYSRISGYN